MKVYSAVSKAVYLLSDVPLEKQVFTLMCTHTTARVHTCMHARTCMHTYANARMHTQRYLLFWYTTTY